MSELEQNSKLQSPFPVVGIGASAGGIVPLKEIVAGIPEDSQMSYVIVQHLSREHESNLAQLLAEVSKIPVREIIHEVKLSPNQIFVIPENAYLVVVDGVLKLEQKRSGLAAARIIDYFFESLADVHASSAIGVLLSGAGFDGTVGLKKIRERGGTTLVQHPATAQFPTMPQNAIEADAVDFVLEPQAIPEKLTEIIKTYTLSHGYSEDEDVPDKEVILKICNLIFLRTGNDFRHYKQPTIRRRIARRMVITRKESLASYYNFLRSDESEQVGLFNDMLIPVTYFFRDDKLFEKVTEEIFPLILNNVTNSTIRVWVAGCSTGEEAYSFGILLHEYLSNNNRHDLRIQIFASDISEKSISKARAGIYTAQDVQQVSEIRRNTYFTKRDGRYHVNKIIRDMCVFSVHNFIKDPPFARIDLLSCRNVLIYMDSHLQNQVLGSFHYALKEKGILFLGKSESLSGVQHLFENFGDSDKIFIRKFSATRHKPASFKPMQVVPKENVDPVEKKPEDTDFNKKFTEIILNRFTPAGVVINDHYEIVHFHGNTSDFLEPSPGKPNFNILKMAREGLAFELRNALAKVKNSGEYPTKTNIAIKRQPYLASFQIVPLGTIDRHMMIIFNKIEVERENGKFGGISATELKRVQELERELDQMREDIKRVTEEQQTAFEELQTTNEELLSTTEELQALNEELETSTEERQSNNEELMCVNDELLDRHEQLLAMRNYPEFVVRTIREPLIIVDSNYIIQGCNPAYFKSFGSTESDTEGRSFFEVGNRLWDIPELREILKQVMNEKIIVEGHRLVINTPTGRRSIVANIRPITDSKPVPLFLIALEDLTELEHSNELLRSKNADLLRYNEQLALFSEAASRDLEQPLSKIKMLSSRILNTMNFRWKLDNM